MFIKTLGALKLSIKTVLGLVKPQAWPTSTTSVPKSTTRGTVAVVWIIPSLKYVSEKFLSASKNLTAPLGALSAGITSLTTTQGRLRSSLTNQKR